MVVSLGAQHVLMILAHKTVESQQLDTLYRWKSFLSGEGTTVWVWINFMKHHPFHEHCDPPQTQRFCWHQTLDCCSYTTWLNSQACTDPANATLQDFSKLYCGLPHNAFITQKHTCLCPAWWIDRGWFYTGNMSHACFFKNRWSGVLAEPKPTCLISPSHSQWFSWDLQKHNQWKTWSKGGDLSHNICRNANEVAGDSTASGTGFTPRPLKTKMLV